MQSAHSAGAGQYLVWAPWLVCDPDTVVRDGAVRVAGGLITHAGHGVERLFPDEPLMRMDGCALIPGLVNAHTHLELTGLRGVGRGLPFAEWIRVVAEHAGRVQPGEGAAAAHEGVCECLRSAVTCVADHSTFGCSGQVLAEAGLRGVVYQEVFLPDPRQGIASQIALLRNWFEKSRGWAGESLRAGLSCHAPYNASPAGLAAVLKSFPAAPRSIHVSESRDEVDYIARGSGVMADRHRERGIRVETRDVSPVRYLAEQGYWTEGTLAVHLAQAGDKDLRLLRELGCTAAFCPGSNAALGNGIPPIARAWRLGLTAGLGTDSTISRERLDMFEEMRLAVLLSRASDDALAPGDAFRMATTEGARAVGLPDAGRIASGGRADFAAVRLTVSQDEEDVAGALVMRCSSADVRQVWVAGREMLSA